MPMVDTRRGYSFASESKVRWDGSESKWEEFQAAVHTWICNTAIAYLLEAAFLDPYALGG
jgi:hypothetical protein